MLPRCQHRVVESLGETFWLLDCIFSAYLIKELKLWGKFIFEKTNFILEVMDVKERLLNFLGEIPKLFPVLLWRYSSATDNVSAQKILSSWGCVYILYKQFGCCNLETFTLRKMEHRDL